MSLEQRLHSRENQSPQRHPKAIRLRTRSTVLGTILAALLLLAIGAAAMAGLITFMAFLLLLTPVLLLLLLIFAALLRGSWRFDVLVFRRVGPDRGKKQ
jgi:hypothetical protein